MKFLAHYYLELVYIKRLGGSSYQTIKVQRLDNLTFVRITKPEFFQSPLPDEWVTWLNETYLFFVTQLVKHFLGFLHELALWSRGRVDGSQLEGPRFDPHASLNIFTIS